MAVLTGNLDRVRHLTVEMTVGMGILLEMAVDAVHPSIEMDR